MPHPEFRREMVQFLSLAQTMSLGTVNDAGHPHAANLWYVTDEALRFYFVSDPASEHSRHVARDPRVALTVYAHTELPEHIHGVQAHGRCSQIDGDGFERVMELFRGKFPAIASSHTIRERLKRERFYVVTPSWMRWIDNRRGFGWKFEMLVEGMQ